MKKSTSLVILLALVISLNSCGLFRSEPEKPKGGDTQVTGDKEEENQQKEQTDGEKTEIDKEKEDTEKKEEPEKEIPKVTYPRAVPVVGRPGYVYSPYNNRIVDVVGLKSGMLVYDPDFPKEQKKCFYVP